MKRKDPSQREDNKGKYFLVVTFFSEVGLL